MGKKVLLIQDNVDCTEIMRYILEEDGFEVLSSESDEVLASTASYHLVIVDEFSEERPVELFVSD